ncbi:piggyBac transposable element-derived protein 4-like [Palaemon carinicauda]|uniref:piggyBac transposable element-derived protein 4-like n=1 Tax=Palaemon carinicauda TaxID=392227 RepID=UPI0035B5F553
MDGKKKVFYSQAELDEIMNNSGLTDVSAIFESDDESEIDHVEYEVEDNSDMDKDYEQPPSTDDDSEEFMDEQCFQSRARKRKLTTSTPRKPRVASQIDVRPHPPSTPHQPLDDSLPSPSLASMHHSVHRPASPTPGTSTATPAVSRVSKRRRGNAARGGATQALSYADPAVPPALSADHAVPPAPSADPAVPPAPSADPAVPPPPSANPSVPPTPSADPAVPPPPSADPAVPPPVARGRRRSNANEDDKATRMHDFGTSTVTSKSGYRWNCRPQSSSRVRTPARNIVGPITSGPTPEARSADTPEKALSLFFGDNIIDEIVQWTNKIIPQRAAKYTNRRGGLSLTEPDEIRALFGLLIFSGGQRDNHLTTREMFSPKTGPPIYRAAMSEDRFCFLLSCLRFDDKDTRAQRQTTDKFAAIRVIWEIFIDNCGKMYVPSETVTVDEQLLAFHGNCPFRMYIPSKPAKYGIKLFLICDSKSKYMLRAIPYLGKEDTQPQARGGINVGHKITKELTEPYHNRNRNVTTDNWFSSVPLVTDLLHNCGMTLVGTVKANKKEIPQEMKETRTRMVGSSAFLFVNDITLVSYCKDTSRTKKKLVYLLSSMHTQPTIMPNGKPEIICFYNETKGGVDAFDQMCAIYSVSRKTSRWPMSIFYGMINSCVINSWIIYKENQQTIGSKPIERRFYMQNMAEALIKAWAGKRMFNTRIPRTIKTVINTVCNIPLPVRDDQAGLTVMADSRAPMVRCSLCDRSKDRKTRHRCQGCTGPVCPQHIYTWCVDCPH